MLRFSKHGIKVTLREPQGDKRFMSPKSNYNFPHGRGEKPASAKEQPVQNNIEQVNLLLAEVENTFSSLTIPEQLSIVGRIFEHSIEDGIKLAERLRLQPDFVEEIMLGISLYLKHSEVLKLLEKKIASIKGHATNPLSSVGFWNSQSAKLINEDSDTIQSEAIEILSKERARAQVKMTGVGKKLYDKIDTVYAEFLRAKKLSPQEAEKVENHQVAVAENHLEKVKRAFDRMYYSGDVYNFFKSRKSDDLDRLIPIWDKGKLTPHVPAEDLEEMKQSNFVPEVIIKMLTELFSLSEAEKKQLDRYRYRLTKEIYQAEKGIEERELTQVLNASLSARGLDSIKLNKEKDEYEVPEASATESKDAKETKEPKVIERKDVPKNLEDGKLYTFAGKVFALFRKTTGEYILSEDGQKSKVYDEIDEVTQVGQSVSFICRKGDNIVVADMNGNESPAYDMIKGLKNFEGEPAYITHFGDSTKYGIVCGDSVLKVSLNPITDMAISKNAFGKLDVKYAEKINGKARVRYNHNLVGKDYEWIRRMTNVGNGFYYVAYKGKDQFVLVDENGNESFEGNTSPYNLTDIGGKLAFVFLNNIDQLKHVSFNNQVGEGYPEISELYNLNGQVLYWAVRNYPGNKSSEWVVVHGDKEIYKSQGVIKNMSVSDGKIFILEEIAGKIKNVTLAVEDGAAKPPEQKEFKQKEPRVIETKELPNFNLSGYIKNINGQYYSGNAGVLYREDGWTSSKRLIVHEYKEIGGQLFYSATDLQKRRIYSADGRKFGEEYDSIGEFKDIGGKLFFEAEKNGKQFIACEDGREFGENYDTLRGFIDIGGKLFFWAHTGGGESVIVSEAGKEFGKKYELVSTSYFTGIGGKLYYWASKNGEDFVVSEDGDELKLQCDDINELKDIGGRLFYSGLLLNGQTLIFGPDGKKFGEEYDEVEDFWSVGGKLYYRAKKNGIRYLVNEAGEKLDRENSDVNPGIVKDINGQLYYTNNFSGKSELVSQAGGVYKVVYKADGEIKRFDYYDGKIILLVDKKGKAEKVTIEVGEEQPKQLNEFEQQLLTLINLIHKPDQEKINQYFEKYHAPEQEKSKAQILKDFLSQSKAVAKTLTEVMRKSPQYFLDTIAAKSDRMPNLLAEKLFYLIFPEALAKQQKSRGPRDWLRSAFGGQSEKNMGSNPQDYLTPQESEAITGGGKETMKDNREILELRDPTRELVVSNILGKCESENGLWKKSYFTFNPEISDPVKETTLTIPDVSGMKNVKLPLPLGSKIITERVKGIDKKGRETGLEVFTNSLGEVVVKNLKNIEKIIYSVQYSEQPRVMPDITEKEQQHFKKHFEKDNGQDLSQEIAQLPEEVRLFLETIKTKSPKERVIAIEQFVRQISYYDYDNQQVSQMKTGRSVDEQFYIMESRLEEIKAKNPKLAQSLAGKKYAGVCADFSQLTTALLRAAGFMSGVMSGFAPEGKTARVKHAHQTAYVVWPGTNRNNEIYMVDGTPEGVTGVSLPSIAQKQEQAEVQIKEFEAVADKKLKKIMEVINSQDAEAIRKLENGELESVLNAILQHQVKMEHFQTINRVLTAYWYSPAKDFDLKKDEKQLEQFLTDEIEREREIVKVESVLVKQPAGKYLFELIQSFSEKLVKGKKSEDLKQSFNLIEAITKIVSESLNETEKKAVAAVVTYLRAKKMAK